MRGGRKQKIPWFQTKNTCIYNAKKKEIPWLSGPLFSRIVRLLRRPQCIRPQCKPEFQGVRRPPSHIHLGFPVVGPI